MATTQEIAEALAGMEIPFTAQGVDGKLVIADLHVNSVIENLRYGTRRKMQDTINSAAKVSRDSRAEAKAKGAPVPPPYDAKHEVQVLVDHMIKGTVPVRGEGITSLDTEMFRLARAAFKAKHGKEANKALGEKIPAEVRVVLTAFMGDGIDEYRADAKASLERKAAEAQARAEEIARLLNKRNETDFDLAKFGL